MARSSTKGAKAVITVSSNRAGDAMPSATYMDRAGWLDSPRPLDNASVRTDIGDYSSPFRQSSDPSRLLFPIFQFGKMHN